MTDPGSGIHFSQRGARLRPPEITRLMAVALETPGLLSLAAGFTDTTSLPKKDVAGIVDRLANRSGPPECLQYGSNQGRPGLRERVADRIAEEDGRPEGDLSRDRVVVTNGSQQALQLASDVICDPGDIVFVERPTYFVYLDVLRGLGVEPRSIPTDVDTGAPDPAAFAHLLEEMKSSGEIERVRAVYLISYFSNPASRSLDAEEKGALARVLRDQQVIVPVIEDAAYRELHFGDPACVPSVLSHEAFQGFPRLYLGTCTKPFATGLKVGYGYCTDDAWLDRILYLKGAHDFGTANLNQAIVEEALRSEILDEHLETIRPIYQQKMEVLHEALQGAGLHELGWSWTSPSGGLYLWLRAPDGTDTGLESAFCRRCLERGVLYVPGELCYGDDPERSFVRLSFGVLNERELREAAGRFVEAARAGPE